MSAPTLLASLAREPVGDLAVGPDARRRRRSAMPAAIRRCAPATPPTGSCRSTSSPNGSPIRCSSRWRPPASRWWTSTSSPRCRNIATAACWSISAPFARARRSIRDAPYDVASELDRRMARADGGADGPAGGAGARRACARRRASRCRTCCRAAPGAPAARSRWRCARRTAPRRFRSCRTGRCFRRIAASGTVLSSTVQTSLRPSTRPRQLRRG